MKVKAIKVEKGRTVNLGRYNSVFFRYGMEAEPDDDERYEDVQKRVEEEVDRWVEQEFSHWK